MAIVCSALFLFLVLYTVLPLIFLKFKLNVRFYFSNYNYVLKNKIKLL